MEQIIYIIKNRPEVLLKNMNIFSIKHYINGYLMIKTDMNILEYIEKYFKKYFNQWVDEYYKSPIQSDWASTIFYFENNHEVSIKKFVILYENFKETFLVKNKKNDYRIDYTVYSNVSRMNLEDLILLMKKRPLMYIGDTNIFYLEKFLDGYLLGKNEHNMLNIKELQFKNTFNEWIQNYYDITDQKKWSETLYFFNFNHENAVKLFFNHFNEFMQLDY